VKTIKLSQALRPLAEYAADLRGEIIVLTARNRAVAAIVPLKESDQESLALSGHPEFLELIARSRAEFRRGQTLSLEEMRQAFPSRRSISKRVPAVQRPGRKPATKRVARRRPRG